MALHQIIEKHKVSILGQEITYTNQFIKHTEGTSYGIKPQSSLISHTSKLFKYNYEHPYIGPTLHVVNGKKYLLPMWKEVHPQTTYNDINWIKPTKKEPIEKNTWKFESSSAPGIFYIVRQSGLKLVCNCSGFYRSKIRKCKHVLQVEKEVNK